MSSSVLVVVIVGCIVVVVVGLAITEAQKPATPSEQPRREAPAPQPTALPEATVRVPAFTAEALAPEALPGADALEPLAPTWGQRARATILLGVTVLVLGSLAAGLIGGALYLGLRTLDRALG